MDKNKINELLNATFEMEGLLTLANSRDVDMERLESLIISKARAILAIAEGSEMRFYAEEDEKQNEDIADSTLFEEEEDANPSEPVSPPRYTGNSVSAKNNKFRSMFSLNDKFRFRHELFGDSGAAFDASLEFIDSLDSIEEAEDYVYGDLGMDQENEVVREFMAVVEKYFQS